MSTFGDSREHMNEMLRLLKERMEEAGVSLTLQEVHEVLAYVCEYEVPYHLRKGGRL